MKSGVLIILLVGSLNLNKSNFIDGNKTLNNSSLRKFNHRPIKDFPEILINQTREYLINTALAIEDYIKKLNKRHQFFFLSYEKIKNYTNEEIINYITKKTLILHEINTKEKLERLTFGNSNDREKIDKERKLIEYMGALSKHLFSKCVIGVQDYDFNVNLIQIKGGIHDYVKDLTNNDLIEFMMENDYYYNDSSKKLNTNCSFTRKSSLKKYSPAYPHFDFKDIYYLFDFSLLKTYAKILAIYNSETIQPKNYTDNYKKVNNLNREEIIKFIKYKLELFPEMNSIFKMEEIRLTNKIT